MKKTIAAFVAGAALSSVALPACAQTFTNEVSISGSWEDIREPTKFEQTTVVLRYGRFMSPQIVGTAGLQHSSFKGSGIEATNTGLTVGAKYYITVPRNQAISPFLDASVGVARTDNGTSDSTDFTWELGGGISWFFTQATSVDAALRLFHTSTEVETKGTRFFLGITTRF
jgi:opacity protein-like surface antigen